MGGVSTSRGCAIEKKLKKGRKTYVHFAQVGKFQKVVPKK